MSAQPIFLFVLVDLHLHLHLHILQLIGFKAFKYIELASNFTLLP